MELEILFIRISVYVLQLRPSSLSRCRACLVSGEFDELRFVMPAVMIIKLKIEDPKILFEPTFRECRDIILRCFSEIIASGEGLYRVECELFPDIKGQQGRHLMLKSVKIDEALVSEFTDKVMDIFKRNTIGPQK